MNIAQIDEIRQLFTRCCPRASAPRCKTHHGMDPNDSHGASDDAVEFEAPAQRQTVDVFREEKSPIPQGPRHRPLVWRNPLWKPFRLLWFMVSILPTSRSIRRLRPRSRMRMRHLLPLSSVRLLQLSCRPWKTSENVHVSQLQTVEQVLVASSKIRTTQVREGTRSVVVDCVQPAPVEHMAPAQVQVAEKPVASSRRMNAHRGADRGKHRRVPSNPESPSSGCGVRPIRSHGGAV